MNDKEKVGVLATVLNGKEKLEEENNILRKRIKKLESNSIRNMDARLESIENKLNKFEDCFRYLFKKEGN